MKKFDRKERKRKRKQRKLARVLKRAGIAQDQIEEIQDTGVAVSLNLTPQQVALLTSPKKQRLFAYESEYLKVSKRLIGH